MSKLSTAVRALGLSAFAESIGETPQCVANWLARGVVPIGKCATVEEALRGKVSKRDLRPKDWRSIWPEHRSAKH